jgi:hypothetical protein
MRNVQTSTEIISLENPNPPKQQKQYPLNLSKLDAPQECLEMIRKKKTDRMGAVYPYSALSRKSSTNYQKPFSENTNLNAI